MITQESQAVAGFARIPAESGRNSGEFRYGLSHESLFQSFVGNQQAYQLPQRLAGQRHLKVATLTRAWNGPASTLWRA